MGQRSFTRVREWSERGRHQHQTPHIHWRIHSFCWGRPLGAWKLWKMSSKWSLFCLPSSVCTTPDGALTGGQFVKGSLPQLLDLSNNQQRNPPHHVSFSPVHASPPGTLTAAAARRGPLVKLCCHTPWHLPPYLRSKCQNLRCWMFDFYLFMWCFCSPSLLNKFQNTLYT